MSARGGGTNSPRRRCASKRPPASRPKWTGAASHVSVRMGGGTAFWVFVMILGWSRACYVELVRCADTASFIQCHVNTFEYLGGVPRRCLYDKAEVVTLRRDEERRPIWNRRMLDFAMRLGFEVRLCRPYRAQTKGKVESGVKYVRRNMWPSMRLHRRRGPEPSGAGVVRRRWQCPDIRDDAPGALGDADGGAPPLGEAARAGHSVALSP